MICNLQVFLGKAQLDIEAILTKQRILLKSIPRGTAKIVFTARDFGHFLAHPLLRQAAATAVQVFVSWPTHGPELQNIKLKVGGNQSLFSSCTLASSEMIAFCEYSSAVRGI